MSASSISQQFSPAGTTGSSQALYAPGGLQTPGAVMSVGASVGGGAVLQNVAYAGSTGYAPATVASLSSFATGSVVPPGAGVCVTPVKNLYAPLFTTYSGSVSATSGGSAGVAGPAVAIYRFGEGQQYPGGPPIYSAPVSGDPFANDCGIWAYDIQSTVTGTGDILSPFASGFIVVTRAGIGNLPLVCGNLNAQGPASAQYPVTNASGVLCTFGAGGDANTLFAALDLSDLQTLTLSWTLTRLGGAVATYPQA